MDRYRVVSDHWAREEVEVTVQEFEDTCQALGWPVLIMVAGAGGVLAARWYTAEDRTRV